LQQATDFAGAAVSWAYPVGDLALLSVLVSIRARSSEEFRIGDVMVAGAIVVFAVGDIVYARLAVVDAYDVGSPVDITWSIAFLLVALAAGRELSAKRNDDQRTVPLLAVCGIAGMVLLAGLAIWTRLENTIVLAGAVATALLVVGRLVVLLLDRSRLLRAYDEKVEQLEEANAARERFIATVSHDLRSPLASISGFAELLREPEIMSDPQQVIEMTTSIERNARRLARLTEDLLCAGQLATGHPPPLRLASIDCRQIAEEAIGDMGLSDRVSVKGSRWIYAMADKQRVQQMIVNLVENAFKHSGSKEVQIGVVATDDGPVIEVADHGVGITPERIAQIFDPFVSDYQSPSSVGLGLYVVRNLVTAMGGRISVTSESDVGTTFRIVLMPAVQESVFTDVTVPTTAERTSD
jgi:signal transduction histidine kinase